MTDQFARKNTGIRARTIDKISSSFSLLGVQLRRQLDKVVLRKSSRWVKIAFLNESFNKDYKDFGDPEMMLASFKSDGENYTRQNYFIIKDKEMAKDIVKLLKKWFDLE